jgi:YbbR domain-containing protein
MVPVTVTVTGNPASGYRVALTLASPSTLQIVGPEKSLSQIDQVATQPVSVKDVSESFKKEIALDLPSDVTVGSDSSLVTAQVKIEENIIVRRFENIPVEARNTVFTAKITPPTIDIDVRGAENTLASLSVGKDIQAHVDLTDLSPGTYARRAQFNLPPGTTYSGADPEVFTVTIRP